MKTKILIIIALTLLTAWVLSYKITYGALKPNPNRDYDKSPSLYIASYNSYMDKSKKVQSAPTLQEQIDLLSARIDFLESRVRELEK